MMAANRLTFKATMAQVSVPATSANLGPGFDTFAIALELRDRYAAIVLDTPDFDVDVTGEGAAEIKKDKNNLVIKAMLRGFEYMGQKPKGIELRQLNAIPHSRGLGSSAAAIVGGLTLARNLVLSGDELLPNEAIIEIGSELEGHPDNVAAAVLGSATIAWRNNQGKGEAVSIPVNPAIKCVAFVPESHLSTNKARKLLPESISHSDAVKNSANTALLTYALEHRPDLLLQATEDFLHQSYRREAMPKSLDLVVKLRAAGVPAMISGAGSSVLVLHTMTEAEEVEFIKVGQPAFTAHKLAISPRGVE
jgi:homoserine kinase